MSKEDKSRFQTEKDTIHWKLHFSSNPEKVFKALTTDENRKKYWAESTEEKDGKIRYVFLNGVESTGEILEKVPNKLFVVTYFGWEVTFKIVSDGKAGSDMEMISKGIPEDIKMEIVAGWVSWLMAMKASVDFGVDLRNHDPKRTWFSGYVDN